MYCPGCGNQMHEEAPACPACGRPNDFAAEQAESKSWFSFRGRISRKEYWLHYTLPLWAISLLSGVIDGLLNANGGLSALITLATLVPSLGASVKRAHDRGRSGWFVLLWLLPVIGWIWLFVELGFLRGTIGRNRFGRDPVRL